MITKTLSSTDWTRPGARFRLLAFSFSAGAVARWGIGFYLGEWGTWLYRVQDSPGYFPKAEPPTVGGYVMVMSETLAWGVFIALILTASSRREVAYARMQMFAVLACYLGWDAVTRMMMYAFWRFSGC